MPSRCKRKYQSDRCVNPLGVAGHVGKSLEKVSKSILDMFPHVPENTVICHKCRKCCKLRKSSTASSTMSLDLDSVYTDVPSNEDTRSIREQELEELLQGLKEKFDSLPENDPLRLSILTIAPNCWSIRKISDEFDISYRMAKKAKDLRKSQGVLAQPVLKTGKKLPEQTVSKVIEFYKNDVNSRIMPHKKATVTVATNDGKIKVQKRLLLVDMKILHNQFKEQFPEYPIGLSRFCELCPKQCVLAGSSGTHIVCVCIKHQNVKTMIDAAELERLTKDLETPLNNYDDCLQYVLCKNPLPVCYLEKCESCPDMKKFKNYLTNLLEERNIAQIIFSTWQATDRCTLKQECLQSEDFIIELCDRLKNLLFHHFISKSQSKYISERKRNLQNDEVLVQCDFAENYAYVVQDAAQAFHYNNEQCTVFPVVFYYKSGNEIKHRSLVLLSDSKTHDTAAVYIMQQKIIPEIYKTCSEVKKILYVSDGARQHFKNKFQMCNLVHHKIDFGITAEWHYYATAHGKGACDGIGAIVKREATRTSLQAKSSEAILNSEALFNWAKKKFTNIQFFFYSVKDHKRTQQLLRSRFSKAPRVMLIQNAHAFIPSANNELQVMTYSGAVDPIITISYESVKAIRKFFFFRE